jgi:hypothetical protein
MSFSLTTEQMRWRKKCVTRRLGWKNLKPGDLIQACEKCMGLKKGEKVKRICVIRIVSVRTQEIGDVIDYPFSEKHNAWPEMIREGFPRVTPMYFLRMFCQHMRCNGHKKVQRIEFDFVS